jgi:hypothetical protein
MSGTHYTHWRGQMKIELHPMHGVFQRAGSQGQCLMAVSDNMMATRTMSVLVQRVVRVKTTAPLGLLLLSSATLGCQADGRFEKVPESICTSGEIWAYLDKDSPLMNPGRSCVQCHAETNDPTHAPLYTLAGTVMEASDEENDCRGADDMTVTIVDAAGVEWPMLANSAGNFWLAPDVVVAMPYTARIEDAAGNTSVKQAPVNNGDCASCHSPALAGMGPGRLVPPGQLAAPSEP